MTVSLERGSVHVTVSPKDGGRVSSLVVAGRERLVVDPAQGLFGWGCYVIAPWAGRLRNARLDWDGRSFEFEANAGAHSLHGTTINQRWNVEETTPTRVVLRADLGSPWPFGGDVTHSIELDERSLFFEVQVHSTETMPIQVGWHPWFVAPVRLRHSFRAMHLRGADGIPTGELVPPTPGPHDDCFVDPLVDPVVTFDDGLSITMRSDCSHWVVYDMPSNGLCVEPQSGPPNEPNVAPVVVEPGQPFSRVFSLTFERYPQIG